MQLNSNKGRYSLVTVDLFVNITVIMKIVPCNSPITKLTSLWSCYISYLLVAQTLVTVCLKASKQTNKTDLFAPLNRVTLMQGMSETGQLVTVQMEMGVSVARFCNRKFSWIRSDSSAEVSYCKWPQSYVTTSARV